MAKKMWGGRFKKAMDKDFEEFSKSISYDYKLAEYDILHSIIHITTINSAKIITNIEYNKLLSALRAILKDIRSGKYKPDFTCEDVHTDIQNKVEKKVGKLAAKLHSLRSRNDQVAFDEKVYCFYEALAISGLLIDIQMSLGDLTTKHPEQFFLGYTHTQRAQAVYFADYLKAFFNMFSRDEDRLFSFCQNLQIFVGAGALAGSSLDKKHYEKALKEIFKDELFKVEISDSSLDAVADRDFIVELLSVISIIQMHLSRFAEDMILYSTKEFNFIDLPEEFCTGSSLMPHKKNADSLELVRGSTGKIYGNLISILTTMKGLPLTYNRDMQLDKESLFSSVETVKSELKIVTKLIKKIKLNKKVIENALEDKTLYATELAEYLVYKGVAFKDAHDVVGKLIMHTEDKKILIDELSDSELKKIHNELSKKVIHKVMNATSAVKAKKSIARKDVKAKQ